MDVSNYSQYDNGVKIIGTVTCDGKVIDKDNYQIMVDNGFYLADAITPEVSPTPAPETSPTAAAGDRRRFCIGENNIYTREKRNFCSRGKIKIFQKKSQQKIKKHKIKQAAFRYFRMQL